MSLKDRMITNITIITQGTATTAQEVGGSEEKSVWTFKRIINTIITVTNNTHQSFVDYNLETLSPTSPSYVLLLKISFQPNEEL